MPRKARIISNSGIYHIMTRSLPDKPLFYDDKDKEKMLLIINELQVEENFKIYAYCLMNTHTHFLLDTNGADLSTIMKKLNLRYGNYLRRSNKHKGPVFRGRFNSKPVDNEYYLIQVSKYIHRNPIDIEGYAIHPEEYPFSSLSLYLGDNRDKYGVCDADYVMSFFSNNKREARNKYYRSIFNVMEENLRKAEFEDGNSEYRSERVTLLRDYTEEELKEFLCHRFEINALELKIKYSRKNQEVKAIYVVFLTQFAGKSRKEICSIIGNITQSSITRLCKKGVKLLINKYNNLLEEFIRNNKRIINS